MTMYNEKLCKLCLDHHHHEHEHNQECRISI